MFVVLKNLSKVFGVGLIGLGITPLFSGVALANEDNLESIQAFQQQSAAIAKNVKICNSKPFNIRVSVAIWEKSSMSQT